MFEDFFEDFFTMGFGKPTKIVYNTGNTKDMMPAYWKPLMNKDEKEPKQIGYKAICRTVGLAKEDVVVETTNSGIVVKGETKYEDETYNQYFEMKVVKDILANIDKIEYKTLNGLTYIYLYVNQPTVKKIKINKI